MRAVPTSCSLSLFGARIHPYNRWSQGLESSSQPSCASFVQDTGFSPAFSDTAVTCNNVLLLSIPTINNYRFFKDIYILRRVLREKNTNKHIILHVDSRPKTHRPTKRKTLLLCRKIKNRRNRKDKVQNTIQQKPK